ncbi:hypothetical protein MASR2M48_17550 [Spirochaetota bacterium]
MSDRLDDVRARFRHEARTILNHVVGFGELLAGDSAPSSKKIINKTLHEIGKASLALRQPVLEYVASVIEGDEPSDALRRQVYDRIYDLVSLVQVARRDAPKGDPLLGDVHKVHDAANALADLFDGTAPIIASHADGVALSRAAGHASSTVGKKRISGRILVVDDDSFNREILFRHLERQGHVVCQASSGRDAFAILSEAPFDIIVLDVMMHWYEWFPVSGGGA